MENETKEKRATFTPGPWRVVCTPQIGDGLVATVAIRLKIASAEGVCDHEQEANARLIAAAPAMYEMCKLLLPIMQSIADDGHIRRGESRKGEHADKLREVLAKVDGGKG